MYDSRNERAYRREPRSGSLQQRREARGGLGKSPRPCARCWRPPLPLLLPPLLLLMILLKLPCYWRTQSMLSVKSSDDQRGGEKGRGLGWWAPGEEGSQTSDVLPAGPRPRNRGRTVPTVQGRRNSASLSRPAGVKSLAT